MTNLSQALWSELLKARRSKVPLLTALAFSLAPLMGGFFMIVLKDPDAARRLGVISTKAQIIAGAADWHTYLGVLAQATAIGGFVLFSFVGSWVFGREFSDRTVTDLLALPTPRATIVLAKFLVVLFWALALTAWIYVLGLGVGAAVGLVPAEGETIWGGARTIAIVAGLTITLVTPIAFVASAGRGYLLPLGATVMLVIFAQIIAAAGWGEYFPWTVPALYSGMAGPEYANLGAVSFVLVLAASLVGLLATFVWWEWADQTQ